MFEFPQGDISPVARTSYDLPLWWAYPDWILYVFNFVYPWVIMEGILDGYLISTNYNLPAQHFQQRIFWTSIFISHIKIHLRSFRSHYLVVWLVGNSSTELRSIWLFRIFSFYKVSKRFSIKIIDQYNQIMKCLVK